MSRVDDIRHELKPLTSLRFAAALLVFLDHAPITHNFGSRYGFGLSGVGFFFILSGFILTVTYAKSFGTSISLLELRRFYRARFARIYPVVFVTTILAIITVALFGEPLEQRVPVWTTVPPAGRVDAIIGTLFMVQAWIPFVHVILGVNPPTWTLSAETFFYCCFPFVACYSLRQTRKASQVQVGAIALLLWAALTAWSFAYAPTLFLADYFPPIRMVDFTFGVLLGVAFMRDSTERWNFPTSAEVAVIAIVVIAIIVFPYIGSPLRYAAWMMPPWGLLIFVFARQAGAVSAWLSSATFLCLGRLSFAFYLTHYPITMALQAHVQPSLASAIALIVSLVLSLLIFHHVEQPMRALLMRTPKLRHAGQTVS